MMNNQGTAINFSNSQNIIFHFLFLLLISVQIIITTQFINILYILGLMIFVRSDYEYDWKLILIISLYGFYQDSLLGYPFGLSSLIFLFFFFIGQISNIVLGTSSIMINFYFFIFGLLIFLIFERSYIFFKYGVFINLSYLFLNLVISICAYFILKKILNSSLLTHGK